MDDWRRHAKGLVDRWQRFPLRQRAAMIAVLVAGAVGCLFLMTNQNRSWQPISSGREFTSKELAAIQSVWRDHGLTNFRRDGHKLSVPSDELTRYEAALPKTNDVGTTFSNEWEKQLVGVNVFTSSEELAQRRDNALRNELRRVLKGIPAIADADVIWARSKSRSTFSPRSKVTATINVTPREGFDLSPELAQSLRTAVAGMVPDLTAEDITILDQSTGLAITNDSNELIIEQQHRRQQGRLARQLESRIAAALAHIPKVAVQARLVEVSQTSDRHVAAKPTFGSALVWTPETAENWGEFAPTVELENDAPTSSKPRETDRSDAWQVQVQIPDSYLDACVAQQLLSAELRAANLDDLRNAECARVRGLVRNAMPFDASLVELAVVPTATEAVVAASVPFSAWPHVACSLLAALCLTFAARTTKSRQSENVHAPSNTSLELPPTESESLATVPLLVCQEAAEDSYEAAPAVPTESLTELARLQQLAPQSLADLLRHERPQAIAVLLTRLPTRIASACLSQLTASLQTDVIRRLKSLGEVPEELVAEVARAVCQRMTSPVEPTPQEPTNRVAHLLPATHANRMLRSQRIPTPSPLAPHR